MTDTNLRDIITTRMRKGDFTPGAIQEAIRQAEPLMRPSDVEEMARQAIDAARRNGLISSRVKGGLRVWYWEGAA